MGYKLFVNRLTAIPRVLFRSLIIGRPKHIVAFLPLLSLLFFYAMSAQATIDNPYQLLTDQDYEQRQAVISELWQQARSGSFNGVDDVTIVYRALLHSDSNKAVVIASGRTETFEQYREVAYNFYQHGYSVYIHDHRGQGYSGRLTDDPEKGHVDDFNDYVTDLKTFYDSVIAPQQHSLLFLLAHSMGGAISSLYLQHYPDDFHAAALSAPMHEVDTGAFGASACIIAKSAEAVGRVFSSQSGYLVTQKSYRPEPFKPNDHTSLTHSRARYEFKEQLMADNPQLRLGGITNRWLIEACKAKNQIIEHIDRIKVPVLLLQAELDQVVTARGQNRFCLALAKSGRGICYSGKPLVIKGGYHELLQETDAYRIPALTAILDFFESQVAKKSKAADSPPTSVK